MLFINESTSLKDPDKIMKERLFVNLQNMKTYVSGLLLDVGCGQRPYASMFQEMTTRYVGVDLALPNFPLPRVDAVASVLYLPFKDSLFDTVLCTEVMEHVAEPTQLLSEIYRVLKPGGNLLLTVPLMWRLHGEPYDYYRFTEHGVRYLSEKVGFEVIRLERLSGFFSTLGQVLSFGTAFFQPYRKDNFKNILLSKMTIGIRMIINFISLWIDNVKRIEGFPLGYVLVAKKLINRNNCLD